MAKIIGVIGGIGCGKSAFCDYVAQAGYPVIDTDQVAKQLVAPGQEGLVKLIELIGEDYLTKDGELDRVKLRQSFFADAQLKTQIEQLIHPLVRQAVAQQLQSLVAHHSMIFIAIPVVHQVKQPAYQIDKTVLIECDESTQLQRVQQRDQRDEAAVKAIIAQQASREQRQALADDILHNNHSLDQFHQSIDLWLKQQG